MPVAAPEPLTPPDCDLRDFEFMPLSVVRLRDSDMAALQTPEECWAAVLLWSAAWHQVPAASLADDDRVLANLAGYGRVVKEWMRVRDGALRGFVKCADGRLYHPVVAEKAMEAWNAKIKRLHATECARIRKLDERNKTKTPLPTLPEFMAQRLWITKRCGSQVGECRTVSEPMSHATKADVACDMAQKSCDNGSKGQGQGYLTPLPLSTAPPPDPPVSHATPPPLPPGVRSVAGVLLGLSQ